MFFFTLFRGEIGQHTNTHVFRWIRYFYFIFYHRPAGGEGVLRKFTNSPERNQINEIQGIITSKIS